MRLSHLCKLGTEVAVKAATMAGQGTADFLEYVAVVMDAGSAYTRAGFSGDESPRAFMRTGGSMSAYRRQDRGRVGSYRGNNIPNVPRNTPCTPGPMGEGSGLSRSINEIPSLVARPMTEEGLCLSRPISAGLVNDWAALEQLIGYVLEEELSVRPRDHAFLFTDYPLAPPTQRRHLAELLFETFESGA
ncbi:uncharacterized protein LOC134438074 [Engraulis encrasicolus]|uniref:uncharacterized protein LOC134438074 n=1 Tax=Engraulis encrasicolus TaxID=184585 RepID=UPI002FD40DA9